MNPLDRTIAWLAPSAAERRMRSRIRIKSLENAMAYYDGATLGRRGSSIRRKGVDANAVARKTLSALRDGSRDLKRNHAYAARAVQAICNNTIGTGIVPVFRHNDDSIETEIQRLAKEHLQTTACDVDGRHNFAGLQALAMETMVDAGEVLVRRRKAPSSLGLPVPLQYQVLEPEHLDQRKDGKTTGGGRIVQGVEFDAMGQRTHYWLLQEHPGSGFRLSIPQSVQIPASEILHVYRVDRPGQVRGIPWSAPILLRMADFADYLDGQLVRQKVAASFAIFKINPTADPVGTSADDKKLEFIEPGTVQELGPGEDIKFPTLPSVDGLGEVSGIYLHEIAAGYGVSYEALTGDLKGVNFSSGRMGWLEFQRNIDAWRWKTIIPQLCDPMVAWFLDAVSLLGVDIAGTIVRHTPPPRQMIDPTKEVPAKRDEIRAGLTSWSQSLRERGLDPEEHFEEMAKDKERIDRHGLILDSDPSKVSKAGLAQSVADGIETGLDETESKATAMVRKKHMVKKAKAVLVQDGALILHGVIGDEFDGLDSKSIIEALGQFDGADIDVHINSPGGFVTEGLAIYNIFAAYPGRITVKIDALAASMASVVAMAGDEIIMPSNALMMIHNPGNAIFGDADELRKQAGVLDKMKDSTVTIYVAKTGLSRDRISQLLDDETWFTADEALALGFATKVIEPAEAKAFIALDLSPFSQVPAALAMLVAGKPATEPREVFDPRTTQAANTAAPSQQQEVIPMANKPKEKAVPEKTVDDDSKNVVALADATEAGAKAERTRASDIRGACAKAKLDTTFADTMVKDGVSIEDARAKIIDKLAEKQPAPTNSHVPIEVTNDERDKFMEGARNAIIQKAGQRKHVEKAAKAEGKDASFDPGEFRGARLSDIARYALGLAGVDTRRMSAEQVVISALTAQGSITQSTSDFAVLLENTMHKILLANYAITPDTWSRWCAIGSVTDFRPHNRYRRGSFGRLDQVAENGELKNKTIPDGAKELISVLPYGNIINLSRQAIVNDDLNAFESIAADLGRAAKLSIELDVYIELALNSNLGPDLNDGDSMFHANHNNIDSTGATPSVVRLDAMGTILAQQTDVSGNEVLDIKPAIWLGPVAQRGNVIALVGAEFDPDTANKLQKPNIVKGIVSDIVATARLSGTRYYLLADPSVAPVMEVAFLNGEQEPRVALQEGFRQQGVEWKVELDYGVGGIDFRGAVTNAGA